MVVICSEVDVWISVGRIVIAGSWLVVDRMGDIGCAVEVGITVETGNALVVIKDDRDADVLRLVVGGGSEVAGDVLSICSSVAVGSCEISDILIVVDCKVDIGKSVVAGFSTFVVWM